MAENVFLPGTFIRRYKRFFADVIDHQGHLLTLHCPNTGSMKNCLQENTPCWYSLSANPKRKLPGTLEIVTTLHGQLAGVNTIRANKVVEKALTTKQIPSLQDYDQILKEVAYGDEKSRIDFLLKDSSQVRPDCYIEVKNVTLDMGDGVAMFPDSVTSRGAKHLRELISVVQMGGRAILLFCVQLSDAKQVQIAGHIDAVYQNTITEAIAAGVEVIAWQASVSADGIGLQRPIEFVSDKQVWNDLI